MSVNNIWAVVPAAGTGSRMGSDIPKQYLLINNQCVIEYSLSALLEHELIQGVVVALAETDQHFQTLAIAKHPKLTTVIGGSTRAESVLAGVEAILDYDASCDWVMVHDAARPCLKANDINGLIQSLRQNDCGAILAQPVVETVKTSYKDGLISATIDRQTVFLAQTPQFFGVRALREGYSRAIAEGWSVTDEASVFEKLNNQPRIVPGGRHNIKITHPEDLALASFYLQQEI